MAGWIHRSPQDEIEYLRTENRNDGVFRSASNILLPNGVDLTNFLVAEVAKSFGFPCKNGGAESLGDFRYALSPRH